MGEKRDEERRKRVSRIVFAGQVVSKGNRPSDEYTDKERPVLLRRLFGKF